MRNIVVLAIQLFLFSLIYAQQFNTQIPSCAVRPTPPPLLSHPADLTSFPATRTLSHFPAAPLPTTAVNAVLQPRHPPSRALWYHVSPGLAPNLTSCCMTRLPTESAHLLHSLVQQPTSIPSRQLACNPRLSLLLGLEVLLRLRSLGVRGRSLRLLLPHLQ
jgi:hypothetical protein